MTTENESDSDDSASAKIFISYSRKDLSFVDRLDGALNARGLKPLIDRSEIYAFEDWWKRIEALISAADTIVFVLSPDAVISDVALKELEFGSALSKRFAPIVCRPIRDEAVPDTLRRLNWIDFTDPLRFDASMDRLVEALLTDIEWVRRHTEFGEQSRRWTLAGRPGPRGLLLRPPTLDEAERWIASRPVSAPLPTPETLEFITESRRATTRRQRLTIAAALGIALFGSALAIWASLERNRAVTNEARATKNEQLAKTNEVQANNERDRAERNLVIAEEQRSLAQQQRQLAEDRRRQADQQRNQALTTQSLFLTDLSRQQLAREKSVDSALLALEALPQFNTEPDRPYVPEAELQLNLAWQSMREDIVLSGHDGAVNSVAYSSDGALILTASDDKTARIWNARTGEPTGIVLKHAEEVIVAAFSPDNKFVVTSSTDRIATVWDATTGEQVGAPIVHDGPSISADRSTMISDVSVSPDGKLILTSSKDGSVRLWDFETHAQVGKPFLGHERAVTHARFSRDGQRIVTASDDKTIRVWNARNHSQIGAPLVGHKDVVFDAEFSPDGKLIVSASLDGTARLWDAGTGKLLIVVKAEHGIVYHASFSPDGTRFITAANDNTARIWSVDTGQQIGTASAGHADWVMDAVFSPDGASIATASYDNTARIWNIDSGASPRSLTGHSDWVLSVAFSPDGKRIVTGSADNTARLWDRATRKPIGAPLAGHKDWIFCAAFSPDGKRIATGSKDQTIRLWDSETGTQIGEPLQGHRGTIWSVSFSPDGKRLLSASDDSTARLWDVATGKPIGSPLTGHNAAVTGAAFDPTGKYIATASADKTARLWDADTQQATGQVYLGHTGPISSIGFDPEGLTIVTSSRDKTIRLWDRDSGRQLEPALIGHTDRVFSARFNNKGDRIVSASDDGTARIWDVKSRKPIASLDLSIPSSARKALTNHAGMVHDAMFSPGDDEIVVAHESGASLWKLFADTHQLVSAIRSQSPRCLTSDQREAAFLLPDPPAWCIQMRKIPYQSADWKTWLEYRLANETPPRPDGAEWQQWIKLHPKN